MLRIGDFSRMGRVTTRLLRHYDAMGLLQPAYIDPSTGYRGYRADQLVRLNQILVLRDLGFSLEQIRESLQEGASTEQLRAMLTMRRAQLERESQEHEARMRAVEHRLAALEGETDVCDVRIEPMAARTIVSIRDTFDSFASARTRVIDLHAHLTRLPAKVRTRFGRFLVVDHARSFEEDTLDLEMGFVLENSADGGDLRLGGEPWAVRQIQAFEQVAVCVRIGPPDEAHRQFSAIVRTIEARGLALAGHGLEVFLTPPTPDQPPVIEMQFPVESVEACG